MTVHENLQLGAYVQIRRGRAHEVESDFGRVFDLFPRLKEARLAIGRDALGRRAADAGHRRALMARPS